MHKHTTGGKYATELHRKSLTELYKMDASARTGIPVRTVTQGMRHGFPYVAPFIENASGKTEWFCGAKRVCDEG
jgi:hypothetical protein